MRAKKLLLTSSVLLILGSILSVFGPPNKDLLPGATTGPSAFTTAANDASVGDTAWANPTNAQTDNGTYATCLIEDQFTSQYLKWTNPSGLSIPAGATINGITVSIERKSSHNSGSRYIDDQVVYIVKGGTIQTSVNKAAAGKWPTTESAASYGGAADLWGQTWTSSDFGSGCGVALRAHSTEVPATTGNTASVDYASMTVTYTAVATRRRASITVSLRPQRQSSAYAL